MFSSSFVVPLQLFSTFPRILITEGYVISSCKCSLVNICNIIHYIHLLSRIRKRHICSIDAVDAHNYVLCYSFYKLYESRVFMSSLCWVFSTRIIGIIDRKSILNLAICKQQVLSIGNSRVAASDNVFCLSRRYQLTNVNGNIQRSR